MKRRRALALGLGFASPLALLGCASGGVESAPGSFRADVFKRPPKGSSLLLLHLPAQTAAYRTGDAQAQQRVAESLTASGYRVTTIEPWRFGAALRKSFEELGSVSIAPTDSQREDAFNRAFSALVADSCRGAGASTLLRTRFVTRRTSLWQSVAKWDGVARQLSFLDAKPGQVKANVEGEGLGISLELVAVSCEGVSLLKRFGGVSLPYLSTAYGAPLPVENPFADARHLAEGIQLALGPLLAE